MWFVHFFIRDAAVFGEPQSSVLRLFELIVSLDGQPDSQPSSRYHEQSKEEVIDKVALGKSLEDSLSLDELLEEDGNKRDLEVHRRVDEIQKATTNNRRFMLSLT